MSDLEFRRMQGKSATVTVYIIKEVINKGMRGRYKIMIGDQMHCTWFKSKVQCRLHATRIIDGMVKVCAVRYNFKRKYLR